MQGDYGDTEEAAIVNLRRFDDWRAQVEVSMQAWYASYLSLISVFWAFRKITKIAVK